MKQLFQFVICVRWVDNDLNVNEDFIVLHKLSVTNAETLAFILQDGCTMIRTRPRTPSRKIL